MKKTAHFLILIIVISLLSGCCLSHEWQDATCSAARTCSKCNKTEGESLPHTWKEPTCTAPKTCSVCSKTEGEPHGHTWKDATCSYGATCTVCGEVDGVPLEHEVHDWWPVSVDSKFMVGTCAMCGSQQETDLDWNTITAKQLLGQWVEVDDTSNKDESSLSILTFLENGNIEGQFLGKTTNLTWVFDKTRVKELGRINFSKDVTMLQYEFLQNEKFTHRITLFMFDHNLMWISSDDGIVEFSRVL